MTTALFGGAFDPPHNGHVALATAALERFRPERWLVLVAMRPGHKRVELDGPTRLRLAHAAFPDWDVEADEHERTVDLLRDKDFEDPLFLVGADEFCDFLSWKEPDVVLELARLGVATRPGFPPGRIQAVLERLQRPERVELFDIPVTPVSSRELRRLVAEGAPLAGLVPPAVEELVAQGGHYRRVESPS
jgi:nicotinate-nucleotide adenylyltransferase